MAHDGTGERGRGRIANHEKLYSKQIDGVHEQVAVRANPDSRKVEELSIRTWGAR